MSNYANKLDAFTSDSSKLIEYMTISSTDSNPAEADDRLHEWLTIDQIHSLYRVFLGHSNAKIGYADFRESLEGLDIHFSDNEFNRLFLRINQNRDFLIDWNEFVSYLIFGFEENDQNNKKESLILPISTEPLIRKAEHRSAVCCLSLLKPNSDQIPPEEQGRDTSADESPESVGMWISASHEGQIRFWTAQLEPERSVVSESIHLKMRTWILAIQALSDVSIICTSSTERELRFHETIAASFTLRMVIRSLPHAVYCMNYSFYTNGDDHSKLIMGDYVGNVHILSFSPILRGPFQSKTGSALIEAFWSDVLKGKIPTLKHHAYLNLHSEIISSVYYSLRLKMTFASAEYRNVRKYRGRCPGLVVANRDERTIFRIPLGVTTFYVDEMHNIIVTGGPDTFVRIWDLYIQLKPSGILTGHNGGIVFVFAQPEENKVYSVDYHKIIKVWDLIDHTLLQSFGDLVSLIPSSERDLSYCYHPHIRELLVGGRRLISIKCNPRVQVDMTDGNTHAGPVSVVLYNRLFRNIVTCGLDSYIIVWDPWTGRRKLIMKSCHTKMVYGEAIDIEITAACFDPLEQFLLTGARDGSLKIWNYNNAVCVRHMSITAECEVTAVIWVVERILAVGWNKRVTEFNDVEGREYSDPKNWPKFHNDDITCASVKLGEGVVTGTYSGEIIFWKLETGQPYRRYNVMQPNQFIDLNVGKTDVVQADARRSNAMLHYAINTANESYRKSYVYSMDDSEGRKSHYAIPVAVQALLFLQTRPMTKEHGTVLVSLHTGVIQMYSHHQRGSYLSEFNAIHKTGDYVLTMTTDRKDRYLFTGSAFGYIKVWHIQNYCIPEREKQYVCMPKLRLEFIFLRKERFLPRAKRAARVQPMPMLLSSYKAHLKAISSIYFINLPKIIVSGGHDLSCRLWSLGGRYLGTLGTVLPWRRLTPFGAAGAENREYRMPPDIQKVASSTTIKVISGVQTNGIPVRTLMKLNENKEVDEVSEIIIEQQSNARLLIQSLPDPVLGKHFALPGKTISAETVELDSKLLHIPVYSLLRVQPAPFIERPKTPPLIERLVEVNYLKYYTPKHGQINYNSSALNIRLKRRRSKGPTITFSDSNDRFKGGDVAASKCKFVSKTNKIISATRDSTRPNGSKSILGIFQQKTSVTKPVSALSLTKSPSFLKESHLNRANANATGAAPSATNDKSKKSNSRTLPYILTHVPTLYGPKPAFSNPRAALEDRKRVFQGTQQIRMEPEASEGRLKSSTSRSRPITERNKPYINPNRSILRKNSLGERSKLQVGLESASRASGKSIEARTKLTSSNMKSLQTARRVTFDEGEKRTAKTKSSSSVAKDNLTATKSILGQRKATEDLNMRRIWMSGWSVGATSSFSSRSRR